MQWISGRSPIEFPHLGIEIDPAQGLALGSIHLNFYGVCIALGLLLAVLYGWKRCHQFGIRQDDITDGVLWIVPLAVICARAYYCIFQWEQYADNPIKVLYIWEGGLAIYGGVLGAVAGVAIFCKIKKINLPALLDLVALGFLIGQSLGRWGNFFNREAFGCYTDSLFAMQISQSCLVVSADASESLLMQVAQMKEAAIAGDYAGFIRVHPTFLYESVWNAVGFVALHFLSKRRQYDGQIALGYVAWYGLGRTLIEGLRMDSLYWGPVRVSQLLAAVSCFAAVVVLGIQALRPHKREQLFVNRTADETTLPEEADNEPKEE